MKKITLTLAFIGFIFQSFSQDCIFYCPVKEGTQTETKHYNAKDKIQSTDKQTILSKKVTGKDVAVTIKSESYDDKDKLVGSRDLTFECKNGVFFFDMKNLRPSNYVGIQRYGSKNDCNKFRYAFCFIGW